MRFDAYHKNLFWAKVNKTETCWLWTAYLEKGYGKLSLTIEGKRRTLAAHRISWELRNGPIPKGMKIDHRCLTPSCVRPEHLRLATNKQNMEHRSGPQRNSKSGIRGVSRAHGKWRAVVRHNGNHHHLGLFDTPEEAEQAAIAGRAKLFTHQDSWE